MATGHEKLETNIGLMVVLILLVISVGGFVTVRDEARLEVVFSATG